MSTFGTSNGAHFVLDDVNCHGNESNIFDCQHPLRTNCEGTVGREAGVICGLTRGEYNFVTLHK